MMSPLALVGLRDDGFGKKDQDDQDNVGSSDEDFHICLEKGAEEGDKENGLDTAEGDNSEEEGEDSEGDLDGDNDQFDSQQEFESIKKWAIFS